LWTKTNHDGQNNNVMDKKRTLKTKLKNEMIDQKILLLDCLKRIRDVEAPSLLLSFACTIHKCAVIRMINLKQIFHILIVVKPVRIKPSISKTPNILKK